MSTRRLPAGSNLNLHFVPIPPALSQSSQVRNPNVVEWGLKPPASREEGSAIAELRVRLQEAV